MKKCAAVLDNLRRARAGVIAEKRTAIRKGMKFNLLGKRAPTKRAESVKKRDKPAWKHRFVCLANYGQKRASTPDADKDAHYKAGLGEKEVEFSKLNLDGNGFRDVLVNAFPNLEEGRGFQFCKCMPNSQNLEPLSKLNSSPEFLKQKVGNVRTYIRPLQRA